MTQIVGRNNRSEFILDPVEAWHRRRLLDQMRAQPRSARTRGVTRGRHAAFVRLDEARSVEAPLRLNRAWALPARMDTNAGPLLKLLQRFQNERVKYALVGGHALRAVDLLRGRT